jgi:phytanoyl-CoA dioxygenase PhyH
MVSLDVRTRVDADIRPIDAVAFFEEELPALVVDRGHLAAPGAAELELESFTVAVAEGVWTLTRDEDRLTVTRGDTGAARVRLDPDELADIVNDLSTPMTILTAGKLRMDRGGLGDFLDWWVVLRSLVDGRPAHTAGALDFRDRNGELLDLRRTFTPHDDDAEMAHFLAEAGFLHIGGLFDEAEMRVVSRDMDGAFAHYQPDDGHSWWARTATGEQRAVRLQGFERHSPTTAKLLDDERLLRIGRLSGDDYVSPRSIEALEKPIGVVEGISDLPWHKDCSLGRHSYRCCSLTVGISVSGADASSGQLAVVPGSHRALVQPAFVRHAWGLPIVDLPTAAGDVTVHCSCTLHMSHAPVARERRVMYTDFRLADPEGRAVAGEAAIRQVREQSYKNVSQKPGHVDAR